MPSGLRRARRGDGTLPVASWPVLREYAAQDLVVLHGPSSEPMRALSAGRPDVAEQLLAPWREPAGERLRLESVYLGRQGTGAGSLRLAARIVGLAVQLLRTLDTVANYRCSICVMRRRDPL